MREIEIFQEPELLTVGLSRFDPQVIAATKKYRERRKRQKLNHLRLMRLALESAQLTLSITEDEDEEEMMNNNND